MRNDLQKEKPELTLVDVMLSHGKMNAEEIEYQIISNIRDVLVYGVPVERRALVARLPKIGKVEVFADHNPPHFRVISPNLDVNFYIDTCELKEGSGISGKQIRDIKDWYFENGGKKLVIALWNKFNSDNQISWGM